MKASELRLGNYIKRPNGAQYNGEIVQVNILTIAVEFKENQTNNHRFLPIKLTEEWLLKFGFHKDGEWYEKSMNYSIFNEIIVSLNLKRFNVCESSYVDTYHEICLTDKLEYVHQLQNIYHSITGEELTLK